MTGAAGRGFAAAFLAGFFVLVVPLAAQAQDAGNRISAAVVPWDAKVAVAAVVMRLRGAAAEEVASAVRAQGSEALEPEPGFTYDGFKVRQIKFARSVPLEGDAPGRSIAAYLHFEDTAGRRTSVYMAADYRIGSDTIDIERASALPLYAMTPETAMFVVPASRAAEAGEDTLQRDFAGLLAFAQANALDMMDAAAAAADDYLVFAFARDRMAPDAKFVFGINDKRNSATVNSKVTIYRGIEGWRVGIFPAHLALDAFTENPEHTLWMKAFFQAGKDRPRADRKRRLVGLYSLALGEAGQAAPPQ